MLKTFFKTALRKILKTKTHAAINLLGLSIGMACAIIIFLFVQHELSYDHFHAPADRIYRLNYDETVSRPNGRYLATTSPPMGPALVQTYPEVEKFVRLRFSDGDVMAVGEKRFFENSVIYADSSFFEVFTFPLQLGNPKTALAAPNAVVLTPAMAAKYFGNKNPLGFTLEMNNELTLHVTGVLQDEPVHSHLHFDFLVSFSTFRVPTGYPVTLESWNWISFHTYLLLKEQSTPAALEQKLPDFIRIRFPERAGRFALRLQNVKDIYLGAVGHPDIASGNRALPYGLSVIGLLILLLAAVNYVNLAVTQSLERSREVGIRKVVGATRGGLMRQFLGESALLACISLVLAMLFATGALEVFSNAFGWQMRFSSADYFLLLAGGSAMAIVVGLLAGSYPALIAANLQPVKILKGHLHTGGRNAPLRKILVTGQFCITIALLSATFVIARQMQFLQSKSLGFEKEGVVVLHILRDGSEANYARLREQLLKKPFVAAVSGSGYMLDGDQGSQPIIPEGVAGEQPLTANIYGVKHEFLELLGVELLQGRFFSEAFSSDAREAIVINKSAAHMLGLKNPIGKRLRIGSLVDGRVIGVVEDFHYASLHHEVAPLAMFVTELVENVYIKLRPGNLPAMLGDIENAWRQIAPDQPFDLTFLDAHLQTLYESDRHFSRLVYAFSGLATFIACIGLFGLATYTSRQRTREIGIRKVLGAGVSNVVVLLSREFVALVLLANFVAWPLAWYVMNRWLQGFAYRIDVSWMIFALAGGLALLIALATVSLQTIKAALANPVDSLRCE